MWIQLTANKSIIRKGAMTHYHPGDWVDVGRQIAQEWIAAGEARTVEPAEMAGSVQATSGIAVRGHLSDGWRERLSLIDGLQLAFFEDNWTPSLPFTETMIWKPEFDLRLDLMKVGFEWLKKWQVVVPLYDYTTLAAAIGTVEEREQTRAIIRDLRVPLRDTRLIFVRRCEDTRELMRLWGEFMTPGGDERLAFLRALYMVKPVVCDTPASWTGKSA